MVNLKIKHMYQLQRPFKIASKSFNNRCCVFYIINTSIKYTWGCPQHLLFQPLHKQTPHYNRSAILPQRFSKFLRRSPPMCNFLQICTLSRSVPLHPSNLFKIDEKDEISF
ncbi:hypothetical protein BdWA1_001797 [Babesia duncani]|uniref:Uncharacterized protein n=1 Tax=Babesia duncani TaxID=323732 RepID=A0AAD9PKJ0_9APIC|nr:hypothetical protein BdWA1_001797 [Babesia duncani]